MRMVYSVILAASNSVISFCTFKKHVTFTYHFRSKLITTQASDFLRCSQLGAGGGGSLLSIAAFHLLENSARYMLTFILQTFMFATFVHGLSPRISFHF